MLPVFGAIGTWLVFRCPVSALRYFAIFLIFLANIIMTGGSVFEKEHLSGIILLLLAAVIYVFHMIGVRRFEFDWKDVLVTVPFVNVVLFFPCWWFMDSTRFDVAANELIFQAVYQGVIVNCIALVCVAYAIRHLGTIVVSLFMSFVLVTTAILAWFVLGEPLTVYEITGIAGCTLGLLLYAKG